MLKTGQSLAAIAAETGFADASHLSKSFKTAFGLNPSDERRRILHGERGVDTASLPRIYN
jgi:transcriptional regulator GlxA family with amidase domain